MNRATFQGYLGKRPETKAVQDFTVTNFSIGVSEKVKGEKKTTWVNCSAFGKMGETIEKYFDKGSPITVSGPVHLRQWESNGKSGASLDCTVREFFFPLTAKPKGDSQDAAPATYSEPDTPTLDEIPF